MIRIISLGLLFSVSSAFAQSNIETLEQMKFRNFSTNTEQYQKMTIDEEGMGGPGSAGIAQPSSTEEASSLPQMPSGMGAPVIPGSGKSPAPSTAINPNMINNGLTPPPNMSAEELADYNKAVKSIQDRYSGQKMSNEYVNDVFSEIEKVQTKNKPK